MKIKFPIVTGRYEASRAAELIKILVQAKINFHSSVMKDEKSPEENILHAERRIQDLQKFLNETLLLLEAESQKGNRIDMEAVLDMELEP
ncbi:MAG: hypothetical protein K1X56_05795 [Flavobacteriales bacterium]|nr:hypothetical protein [Flavobacteriales bacterium]